MNTQQGGWSPTAKTALTLALVALFVVGSVATILLTMRKKGDVTVPWVAGGGEQLTVVRGSGRSEVPSPVAPLPATSADVPESGLAVVFAVPGDEARTDARIARLLALAVRPGEAVSQGLPAGPFLATFSGAIEVDLRDRYRFAFEGAGALTLEVEGKPVLVADLAAVGRVEGDPVRLSQGQNRIVARYRSLSAGEARLRVLWSSSEFAWEPIPPTALKPTVLEGLAAAATARAGHALASRRQCAACHPGGGEQAAAPDLATVGSRLHPAWMQAWLLAPERGAVTLRSMPHLFGTDAVGQQEAEDVSAFLATLLGPVAAATSRPDLADAGGRTFAHLGCIGCHSRPDAGAEGDAGRLPLRQVAAKFSPGALREYLRAPQRHDPLSSMPDFALTEDEAAELAAFLRARAPAAPEGATSRGDAGRGRALAARRGCANCHAGLGVEPLAAPAWSALRDADCKGPPRFDLTASERSALGSIVGTRRVESVTERGERLVRGLRCTACHGLDGATDAFTAHAGEVADLLPAQAPDAHVIDQARPTLTWAGEKLQPSFLLRQLTDVAAARSRPWLHARMPAFPGHAEAIARGLAASHGLGFDDVERGADPQLASVGGDLISAAKGFACVTCHGVGTQGPMQVFEVQGINFARTAERLRPDYFMRWMRDPRRIDPATKMARYSSPEGKTGFTTVFGGDADQQYAAIYAWLLALRGH